MLRDDNDYLALGVVSGHCCSQREGLEKLISAGGAQILLLGTPKIVGCRVEGVVPAKGLQLVALLLRSKSGRMARVRAASMLWDSRDEAAALTSLRQLLARMKRALPDLQLFHANESTVGLGEVRDCIDVCRLELAMQRSDTKTVLGLLGSVTGEFLEGTEGATEALREWIERERSLLRERMLGFAGALLLELTRYGRAPRSDLQAVSRFMLELDPFSETSYCMLIEAYGRNGMFDDAQRLHAAMVSMLHREFGASPSPETNAVTRRVFAWRGLTSDLAASPGAESLQPRIAFFEPEWLEVSHRRPLVRIFLEDVANELCRFRSFVVLAPHSSFQAEHRSGLPLSNDALRADYSVSGFCKPDSDKSVLALRLTNCRTREVVWSGEYNIADEALLRTFSLVTLRVATSLGSAIDRDKAALGRTDYDGGAYVSYLEGLDNLVHLDLPHLRRARRSFQHAIDANPSFAAPRARVAQTLYLEWLQRGGGDPELLVAARQQSELALSSDPNDAVGYWMKGTVALYQRDFESCEATLAEAEVLAPHSADFLVNYADALSHLGHADEGWQRYEKAIDLNPNPPDHYWWAGATIALNQGRYQDAIDICANLIDDEPVLSILASCHALSGNLQEARSYGRRLMDLFPDAIAKSKRVTPDRLDIDRERRLEGLRLAGVTE